MVKFRLHLDKDKETEYINEMAGKGYAMTGFCAGFYSFDRCQPGEYIYQVDINEGFFRISNDYREFMQEMGVEIVCLWGPWVILRKKAAEGPFELYTDVESSIEHYEKIKKLFKIVIALEIICVTMEAICAVGATDRFSIAMYLAGCSLLAALIVFLVREVCRVKEILAELRARLGQEDPHETRWGNRRPSLLLCLGILLNGLAILLMPEQEGSALYEAMRGILHALALILMGAGLVDTLRRRER